MSSFEKRQSILTQIRNLKMARSSHRYVRGSTVNFYAWLESGAAKLPKGPSLWICGDCHLGNLGPLADAKGRVAIQIRDLDQTVIGNPVHDLIRLGLSLASAARGCDLPGVTTARILEEFVAGYQGALREFVDRDRSHRPKPIQRTLRHSIRRRWRHLAEERIEDVEPEIPLGDKFWAPTAAERDGIAALFGQERVREILTRLKARDSKAPVQLVDVAYWVKGCSSLGRIRFAALAKIDEGRAATYCLVDLKEGVPAAAPCDDKAAMPRDNAERVVAGACALSPNLGERMLAARLLGKAVVLRELMPQDIKIDMDHLGPEDAVGLARYLGGVVGRAHGRQLDAGERKAWARDLAKCRGKSLDAPSWLWSSVVELLSVHEAAYLEHCRRFALTQTAKPGR
ncbi:MAG TPA: DUF2252 family protein [Xanthobacteraceae bacterium]|nr:DUF2252 family protein [Xanthobacteraceae bacterium]